MQRDLTKLTSFCGNEIFEKEPEYQRIEAIRLAPRPGYLSGALLEYIPNPADPVKIICFNLHVFQDSNGGGNYLESERSRLDQIIKWTNDHYEHCAIQSDTYPPAQFLKDTRIRFKLNRVEFYRDQSLFTSTSAPALQAAAVARNPATLGQVNVHINAGYYNGAAGFASPPSTSPGFDSWVVLLGGASPQSNPSWQDADYIRACTLAHEFGHVLDLRHTYLGGGSPAICTIGPDFLADVFGTSPNTCPHVCSWPTDATVQEPLSSNSLITNNLMGGSQSNYWISRLQAATMHRALTEKSVKRYVASGCDDCASCVAFTVHDYNHVSQGADAVLSYAHVDLNESWGWAADKFVAPVSGIYHFDVSFVKNAYGGEGTEGDVLISILKNGAFVGRAWSGNGSGMRGTGCVSLNTKLERGDIVTTVAQSVEGAKRNFLEYYFAGHLICCSC